jgi:hypothetical protein
MEGPCRPTLVPSCYAEWTGKAGSQRAWPRRSATSAPPRISGVSHLLHTKQPSHVRAFLDTRGHGEGEVRARLIALKGVLAGGGRPHAVVAFLKPSPPPPPGLRVGAPPLLAPALLPPLPPGWLPLGVTAGQPLRQRLVGNRSASLWRSCGSLRGAG